MLKLNRLPKHDMAVTGGVSGFSVFSSSCQQIIAVATADTILLQNYTAEPDVASWRTSTLQPSVVASPFAMQATQLIFNRSGTLLAASDGEDVEVWMVPVGRLVARHRTQTVPLHLRERIGALHWYDDDTLIITSHTNTGEPARLRFWNDFAKIWWLLPSLDLRQCSLQRDNEPNRCRDIIAGPDDRRQLFAAVGKGGPAR